MITPRIEHILQKLLVGRSMNMSLANNRTGVLWGSFMPHRQQITNRVSSDMISLQIYPSGTDFTPIDPHLTFTKWAGVEVTDFSDVPDGMMTLTIPEGEYAVFKYKGTPQEAEPFFRYVFGTWFPASGYTVANRPHFEVLGPSYKNNDPDSEEEVWIPIQAKTTG